MADKRVKCPDWNKELKNLGVEPDTVIAKRVGVTRERVRQVRQKLGIPRMPRPNRIVRIRSLRISANAKRRELERALQRSVSIS